MKPANIKILILLIVSSILLILSVNCYSNTEKNCDYYYGVEMNNALCGYMEFDTSMVVKDGKQFIDLKHNINAKFVALGSKVNTNVNLEYLIDPITGNFNYHRSYVKQGQTELTSEIFIESDTALFTSALRNDTLLIPLPKDVICENTLIFFHIKRDFVDNGMSKKAYKIFEVRDARVEESVYTKTGEETVDVNGKKYSTIIVEKFTPSNGIKALLWIDTNTGMYVKSSIQDNRKTYLADRMVIDAATTTNIDENILQKTNVSIADIKSISKMKVKAILEPYGIKASIEKLNTPYQKFEGTVNENLIEGVFEIKYDKYDGTNAPVFPVEYDLDEEMNKYVKPYAMIDSDDPVLIKKAEEITEGSKDSWEAACRITKWVAENIDYAIPGGGTARKTYDMRAGECGAHSVLLAAFCRAVNIPARVVWGCMYIPNNGGSFGQHAWNEIFMGEAGWIAVDATAQENDFLDSGHLRLGEFESVSISLNAKNIEVLDYELSSDSKNSVLSTNSYEHLLGQYQNPKSKTVINVIINENKLSVDIPNRVTLPLLEPDENNRWFCALTNKVYVTFDNSEDNRGDMLKIHEKNKLIRQPETLDNEEPVPEKFIPYLGKYMLYMAQAEFKVIFHDDKLAIDDPLAKKIIHLQGPNGDGQWLDEFNQNKISFSKENGTIVSMTIESISEFKKL